MKKLFVLVAVAAMATSAFAFDFMKSSKAVKNGDILAHAGIGFYSYSLGTVQGGTSYFIPPISAAVDYMLPIELPISIGGLVSYSAAGAKSDGAGTEKDPILAIDISNLVIGVRANWHFDVGIDKLDCYSGILLGVDMYGYKFAYTPKSNYLPNVDTSEAQFAYGAQVGLNYFINKKFAVFLEGGYGPAYITVGGTMKF